MTAHRVPNIVVLAGPTGPALLRDTSGITEFVNADTIARGLSAFDPEGAAIDAARVMLRRMRKLADEQEDFAFETTLTSRTFASWLVEEIAGDIRRWVPPWSEREEVYHPGPL